MGCDQLRSPFYQKHPPTKKLSRKNFGAPERHSECVSWYETIRLRLIMEIVVYLWETFVLTGYGSRNSKWVKSYGCRVKVTRRVEHQRCRVQHSFKMLKLCRTNFWVNFIEMKMDFTMVPHIPQVVNGIRSIEEHVLPKASPGEEIE